MCRTGLRDCTCFVAGSARDQSGLGARGRWRRRPGVPLRRAGSPAARLRVGCPRGRHDRRYVGGFDHGNPVAARRLGGGPGRLDGEGAAVRRRCRAAPDGRGVDPRARTLPSVGAAAPTVAAAGPAHGDAGADPAVAVPPHGGGHGAHGTGSARHPRAAGGAARARATGMAGAGPLDLCRPATGRAPRGVRPPGFTGGPAPPRGRGVLRRAGLLRPGADRTAQLCRRRGALTDERRGPAGSGTGHRRRHRADERARRLAARILPGSPQVLRTAAAARGQGAAGGGNPDSRLLPGPGGAAGHGHRHDVAPTAGRGHPAVIPDCWGLCGHPGGDRPHPQGGG